MVNIGPVVEELGVGSAVNSVADRFAWIGRATGFAGGLVSLVTGGLINIGGTFAAGAEAVSGLSKVAVDVSNGHMILAAKRTLATAASTAFEYFSGPAKAGYEALSVLFTGKWLGTVIHQGAEVGSNVIVNTAKSMKDASAVKEGVAVGQQVYSYVPAAVGSTSREFALHPAADKSAGYWVDKVRPQNQPGLVAAPTGQPVFANAGSKAEQIMAARAANDANFAQSQLVNG